MFSSDIGDGTVLLPVLSLSLLTPTGAFSFCSSSAYNFSVFSSMIDDVVSDTPLPVCRLLSWLETVVVDVNPSSLLLILLIVVNEKSSS